MKRDIFGVMIDDLDRRTILAQISKRMEQKRRTVIFTPNPIMTQDAKKDPELMRILNGSDYNIPDGNGMILASRLLKTNLKERICGIELAEELLGVSARLGLRVFLYGGEEGVAKKALPRCNVIFVSGNDMKTRLSGYLGVLYAANPKSIGEKMPDDTFYYTK